MLYLFHLLLLLKLSLKHLKNQNNKIISQCSFSELYIWDASIPNILWICDVYDLDVAREIFLKHKDIYLKIEKDPFLVYGLDNIHLDFTYYLYFSSYHSVLRFIHQMFYEKLEKMTILIKHISTLYELGFFYIKVKTYTDGKISYSVLFSIYNTHKTIDIDQFLEYMSELFHIEIEGDIFHNLKDIYTMQNTRIEFSVHLEDFSLENIYFFSQKTRNFDISI